MIKNKELKSNFIKLLTSNSSQRKPPANSFTQSLALPESSESDSLLEEAS